MKGASEKGERCANQKAMPDQSFRVGRRRNGLARHVMLTSRPSNWKFQNLQLFILRHPPTNNNHVEPGAGNDRIVSDAKVAIGDTLIRSVSLPRLLIPRRRDQASVAVPHPQPQCHEIPTTSQLNLRTIPSSNY